MSDEKREEMVNKAVDDFGGLVRNFRQENFLSLESMAELCRCSPSYIFRIERKKRNPEINFRIRLLTEAMNWSTEDIYLYLDKVISQEKKNK